MASSSAMLRANCSVMVISPPGLLAGIRAPEDDLAARLLDPCLLQQRGQRRAGPGRVTDTPREERQPRVAGALQGERHLLALPGFQVIQRQRHRLVHQAADLQAPVGLVQFGLVEVLDDEELLVRGDPGIELLPLQLPDDRLRDRIRLGLVQPGNDLPRDRSLERGGRSRHPQHAEPGHRRAALLQQCPSGDRRRCHVLPPYSASHTGENTMSWLRLVRTFRAHPRPTASWRRHAISTSVGDTGFREVRSQQGSGIPGAYGAACGSTSVTLRLKRVPRTSFIIPCWKSGKAGPNQADCPTVSEPFPVKRPDAVSPARIEAESLCRTADENLAPSDSAAPFPHVPLHHLRLPVGRLVREVEHAGVEGLGVHQPQWMLAGVALQQPLPAADHDRVQ